MRLVYYAYAWWQINFYGSGEPKNTVELLLFISSCDRGTVLSSLIYYHSSISFALASSPFTIRGLKVEYIKVAYECIV